MIHLITGLPGNGKTLYAVSLIIDLAAKGETIYTNIKGLTVPDVLPLPENNDWRDTPDGSYIFYDEAQYIDIFQSNGRQTVSNHPITRDLSTHRHTGHEIYFITQDASYMHKHILGLVQEHIFVNRPMGSKFPAAIVYPIYKQRPESAASIKTALSNTPFTIKKSIYQYYTSASQHNVKFQWLTLLKKTWIIIAAVLFIGYTLFFSNNSFLGKKAIDSANAAATGETVDNPTISGAAASSPAQAQNGTQSPAQYSQQQNDQHELQRVAFVVATSSGDCYAKNSYGELLDIEQAKCKLYDEHPNLLSSSRVSRVVSNGYQSTDQQSYPNDLPSNGQPQAQQTVITGVSYTNIVPTQQSQDTIM